VLTLPCSDWIESTGAQLAPQATVTPNLSAAGGNLSAAGGVSLLFVFSFGVSFLGFAAPTDVEASAGLPTTTTRRFGGRLLPAGLSVLRSFFECLTRRQMHVGCQQVHTCAPEDACMVLV